VIFLLDTNAISALMRGETKVESWLSAIAPEDRILTCTIVRGEILFGLGRLDPGRRRTALEAKADQLFASVPCEPVPPFAGDHYARLKLGQQRLGLSLDENDLWIAATALALGAALVSNDSDFQRVPSLGVVVP